ncbi:MAG: LPXTG cell wall anchor domain-containing protein [Aeriscardovia sp.]|nr:LPXTG cell wall anchor domain-containing protein [Aeriscardovia sp.]
MEKSLPLTGGRGDALIFLIGLGALLLGAAGFALAAKRSKGREKGRKKWKRGAGQKKCGMTPAKKKLNSQAVVKGAKKQDEAYGKDYVHNARHSGNHRVFLFAGSFGSQLHHSPYKQHEHRAENADIVNYHKPDE